MVYRQDGEDEKCQSLARHFKTELLLAISTMLNIKAIVIKSNFTGIERLVCTHADTQGRLKVNPGT